MIIKYKTIHILFLLNIKPIFYKKIFYETSNARRFNSIYYVVINKEENKLVIQEDEVSEIKWLSLDELDNRFKEKPTSRLRKLQN